MKRGCKHIPKDRVKDPVIDEIAKALEDCYAGDETGLMNIFVDAALETENKVLLNVAAQCLGREFTPEDSPLFTIMTHQDWEDKYQLNYMNIPIGMIERNYGHKDIQSAWENRTPKFGVTFTPFEQFTAKVLKPDCEVCAETVEEVYHCERCDRLICSKCQAEFNQFSQIDFNCCKSCAEQNPD